MEFMPLGNLRDQHRKQRLLLGDLQTVLYQALQGLMYLHDEQGMIHRDVKPDNILVKSRNPWLVKLSDFGLTTERLTPSTNCGTDHYKAAEISTKRYAYTNKVDVWALGVVGLEFVVGLPKYEKLLHRENPLEWSQAIRYVTESFLFPHASFLAFEERFPRVVD